MTFDALLKYCQSIMSSLKTSKQKPPIILVFIVFILANEINGKRNSTCDFIEAVQEVELTCETYKTHTIDNYELELFRIKGHEVTKKKPVLLAHGLFGSSDIFVLTGWKHAVGFNLVQSF